MFDGREGRGGRGGRGKGGKGGWRGGEEEGRNERRRIIWRRNPGIMIEILDLVSVYLILFAYSSSFIHIAYD